MLILKQVQDDISASPALGSLYDSNTAKKLSNVMNASMLDCVTHEVITKEQVYDIESIFFKHIEYNFKHMKANHGTEEKK